MNKFQRTVCKIHTALLLFYFSVVLLTGAAPGEPADYCAVNYTITFNPGEESMRFCREVIINDDSICEGPESFTLELVAVPGGGATGANTATCTINDNDGK